MPQLHPNANLDEISDLQNELERLIVEINKDNLKKQIQENLAWLCFIQRFGKDMVKEELIKTINMTKFKETDLLHKDEILLLLKQEPMFISLKDFILELISYLRENSILINEDKRGFILEGCGNLQDFIANLPKSPDPVDKDPILERLKIFQDMLN